jgi:hypothetical protein
MSNIKRNDSGNKKAPPKVDSVKKAVKAGELVKKRADSPPHGVEAAEARPIDDIRKQVEAEGKSRFMADLLDLDYTSGEEKQNEEPSPRISHHSSVKAVTQKDEERKSLLN